MALYESIRDALGQYQPDGGEEINLKIKPAVTPAAGEANQTPVSSTAGSGAGGGAVAAGGGGSPVANQIAQQGAESSAAIGAQGPVGFGAGGASLVPQAQRLGQNPQLVQTPTGAYTDPMYEASLAAARHETQRAYLDVLQQLGFTNDQGAFVPGLIETEAARRRNELMFGQQVAAEENTAEAQRRGSVFSGRRATLQARAERPFVTGLAELESSVPLQLGKAYQQATDILATFGINMNQLIAEATERKSAIERERAAEAAADARQRALIEAMNKGNGDTGGSNGVAGATPGGDVYFPNLFAAQYGGPPPGGYPQEQWDALLAAGLVDPRDINLPGMKGF